MIDYSQGNKENTWLFTRTSSQKESKDYSSDKIWRLSYPSFLTHQNYRLSFILVHSLTFNNCIVVNSGERRYLMVLRKGRVDPIILNWRGKGYTSTYILTIFKKIISKG